MRCISSIALLVIISVFLVAGCQEPAQDSLEKTVVVQMPDKQEATEADETLVTTDQQPVEATADESVSEATDETQATETATEVKGPKIMVEKIVHDFGDMGPGTRQKCEFPFKNIGDSTLNIDVQLTCGCTVIDPKMKKVYAPGESGTLEVEYHAQIYPAKVRKHLFIMSNDSENPKVTLTLKTTVVKRIDYDPNHLKFFLGEENVGVQEITLTSLDDRSFSIKSFISTADCITADIDPSVEATKFVLKTRVDGEKLKTNLRGRVSIGLTHPECPSVEIFFDVLPKYTVTPSTLILLDEDIKPLQPVKRKLWILSNYKKPFDIDSLVSKDNSVKLLEKRKIRNGYELILEIIPPDTKGEMDFGGEYTIKLNDGGELPITYRGFYQESDEEEK